MEKTTNMSLRIPVHTKREIERVAPTLGHSANSLAAFWVDQALRRHIIAQQAPVPTTPQPLVAIGDWVEWTQPDVIDGGAPTIGKVYEVTSVKGAAREQQMMIRDADGVAVAGADGPWWYFTEQFRIVTGRVL